MNKLLKIIALLISFAAMACVDGNKTSSDCKKTLPNGNKSNQTKHNLLDTATDVVVDSTGHNFEIFANATVMLVYKDSILVVSNKNTQYGEPLISIYDIENQMRHLADYIPRGYETNEMMACGIHINGDHLFVSDCYYTGRYCTIDLRKPLHHAYKLHLNASGVEERGVAIAPFRDGLLVENPQCYSNEEVDIHNDVSRLLYYKNGRCVNPQEPVSYLVADVNTGADIYYNESTERICFVSHRQPLVEFYDDSLRLIHKLSFPSKEVQKIHVEYIQPRAHNNHNRDIDRGNVSFERTRRVVGAGSQFHSFLCSTADEEYIYLVYCGKLFNYDYHTFPSYIIVLDWNGKVVDTYIFDRWVQAISPSMETGRFYLTVYADDDCNSSRMKLVKVTPRMPEETDSLDNENNDTVK